MHDIISDIIDWDQANKAYLAGEGQSGERYIQRLEAADRMAEIEARWHHLPGGFLTRISAQSVEGNLSAVSASGMARLTCGNRNRWQSCAEGDLAVRTGYRGRYLAVTGTLG